MEIGDGRYFPDMVYNRLRLVIIRAQAPQHIPTNPVGFIGSTHQKTIKNPTQKKPTPNLMQFVVSHSTTNEIFYCS